MTKFLLIIFGLSTLLLPAQNFLNPDLDGIINGASCLPAHWQSVPYTDIDCIASTTETATPDLTGLNTPDSIAGINGNPYSGSTFVSGLYGKVWPNSDYYYQEGIMQTVTGLIPNKTYMLSFYQTVVKQNNAIDPTGSWLVYNNATLIGTSAPSRDNDPFSSSTKHWEQRTMLFTPSFSVATFRFLPVDDDTNHLFSPTDTTGAVRMGIDLITISTNPTLGLNNYAKNKVIKGIFPNPANDELTIQLDPVVGRSNIKIRILNYTGELVRTIESDESIIQVEIRDLASGIYFLKIDSEKAYEIRSFVKQ